MAKTVKSRNTGQKGTRGPRVTPSLTEEQVLSIQPFLSRLLRRYQEVADTGSTEREDPICATLHGKKKDLSCVDCTVWGVREPMGREGFRGNRDNAEFIHCEDYYPKRPADVTDDTQGVSFRMGGLREQEHLRETKAWGWNVVMWLEGLRR
jgi:hypothetical protein